LKEYLTPYNSVVASSLFSIHLVHDSLFQFSKTLLSHSEILWELFFLNKHSESDFIHLK